MFVTPSPSPKVRQDNKNKILLKQSFASRAAKLLEEVVQTMDKVQCPSGPYVVRQLEEEFRLESQESSKIR